MFVGVGSRLRHSGQRRGSNSSRQSCSGPGSRELGEPPSRRRPYWQEGCSGWRYPNSGARGRRPKVPMVRVDWLVRSGTGRPPAEEDLARLHVPLTMPAELLVPPAVAMAALTSRFSHGVGPSHLTSGGANLSRGKKFGEGAVPEHCISAIGPPFENAGSARAGPGSRLDMAAMAELVCQTCGEVSWSRVPRHRPDTMPACPCGGRRQIVRIQHHRPSRGTHHEPGRPGAD